MACKDELKHDYKKAFEVFKDTMREGDYLLAVKSALEKQIPIKIYPGSCAIKEDFYKVECPECLGSHITRIRPYYCMDCGQRFDWSVIDECIEREKTKKVKFCRKHYRCPSCNGVVVSGGFCKHCGQALDWGDCE